MVASREQIISVKLRDGGGAEELRETLRFIQKGETSLGVKLDSKDIAAELRKSIQDVPVKLDMSELKQEFKGLRDEIGNFAKQISNSLSNIKVNVDTSQATQQLGQLESAAKRTYETINRVKRDATGLTTETTTVRETIDSRQKQQSSTGSRSTRRPSVSSVSSLYDYEDEQGRRVRVVPNNRTVSQRIAGKLITNAGAGAVRGDVRSVTASFDPDLIDSDAEIAKSKQAAAQKRREEKAAADKKAADAALLAQQKQDEEEKRLEDELVRDRERYSQSRQQALGVEVHGNRVYQNSRSGSSFNRAFKSEFEGPSSFTTPIDSALYDNPERARQRLNDSEQYRSATGLTPQSLREIRQNKPTVAAVASGSLSLTNAQKRAQQRLLKQQNKAVEEFYKTNSFQEVIAGALGGDAARLKVRAEKAQQFAEEKNIPGLASRLQREVPQRALPSLLSGKRLFDFSTLAQVGFAGVFGGPLGLAGAALGGAAFGKQGAFAVSAVQQGAEALFRPLLDVIHKHEDEFKEAGLAYEQSILGITGTLQASSQVNRTVFNNGNPTSIGTSNIGAQLAFQTKQAEAIQQQVRARLTPLGIGGAQEAAFTQGVVNSLNQRGITNATSEQVGTIAQGLAGIIKTQQPGLLDNPGRLNREFQGVFSGRRNILSTLLGEETNTKLKSATSAEDFVNALKPTLAYASAQQGSQNISALLGRLSGAQENLNTLGGQQLLELQKGGVQELTSSLSSPETKEAIKTLASAMGDVANRSLLLNAGLVKTGAGITNVVKGLTDFLAPLTPIASALGIAAVATKTLTAAEHSLSEESINTIKKQGALRVKELTEQSATKPLGVLGNAQLAAAENAKGGGFLSKAGNFLGAVGPYAAIAAALGEVGSSYLAENSSFFGANGKSNAELDKEVEAKKAQADRIGATNSSQRIGTRVDNLYKEIGLDQVQENYENAQRNSGLNRLSQLNIGEEKFGADKNFGLEAPAFYEQRINARNAAFNERTEGLFGGAAGGESLARLKQDLQLTGNLEDRQKIFGQLSSNFANVSDQSSKDDQAKLASLRKDLAETRGLLSPVSIAFGRAGDIGSQAALKSKAGSLEQQISDLTKQGAAGNPQVSQAANELVKASTEINKLADERLATEREITQSVLKRAESVKGTYDTRTAAGSLAEAKDLQEGYSEALKLKRTEISSNEKVVDDAKTMQLAVEALLGGTNSPEVTKNLQAQKKVTDEYVKSKEAELKLARGEARQIEFRGFDAQLQEQRSGAISKQNELAGTDRFTFAGEAQSGRLTKEIADAEIEARNKVITDIRSKSNGRPLDEAETQRITSLQAEIGQFGVQRLEGTRAETIAGFNRKEGQADRDIAGINLRNSISDEISKRQELNIQLSQSTRALSNFSQVAEGKTQGKELDIANRAKRIRELGGSDTAYSDDQIKQAELSKLVNEQNQAYKEVGLAQGASGGNALNIIPRRGGAQFQDSLKAEQAHLAEASRKAADAIEKMPAEFDKLNASLERTIYVLDQKLGASSATTGLPERFASLDKPKLKVGPNASGSPFGVGNGGYADIADANRGNPFGPRDYTSSFKEDDFDPDRYRTTVRVPPNAAGGPLSIAPDIQAPDHMKDALKNAADTQPDSSRANDVMSGDIKAVVQAIEDLKNGVQRVAIDPSSQSLLAQAVNQGLNA